MPLNANINEDTRLDQQLKCYLTHVELLLLLMANNVIKHMDKRLQNKINRINKSDDEHNENNSGIITDRKFDFNNQVYH